MVGRRNGWRAWMGNLSVAMLAFVVTRPAAAHISLEEAGTHKSRYGDGELKDGPCGKAGGTRGTNVYTYQPGQKITVSAIETIPHPGYFRFAFDNDGDDAFIEPASIKPIDPNRKCPNAPTDRCGMSDFYNSPAVLPNMDNLNPHLTAAPATRYTWEVTLPDVECTNCTLQLIQVMEDDLAHGPYDPTPGVGVADIYHQCIDLVLKRSADAGTGGTDAGSTTDVRTPTDAGTGTGSDAPRTDSGGAGGSTVVDASPPRVDAGGGTGGTGGTGTGGAGTGGTGTGGAGTGGTGTGGTGAGGTGTGGSGTGGSATGGAAGASAGRAGANAGGNAGSGPGDDGGCNCTVGRGGNTFGAAAVASLLALALASRRRRR